MESSKGRYPKWRTPKLVEDSPATETDTGERRAWKPARGVRRRAGGKGLLTQYLACGLSYFLLSFIGPKEEVEEIKLRLGAFLQTRLKLELSQTKTLITHARTETAKFLGYHISTFQRDDAHERSYDKRRVLNGKVELSLPKTVIQEQCQRYMKGNKAIHRPEMENDSVFTIISFYQSVYRGIAEYYRMAHKVYLLNKLKWIMETSLTKTLAAKLKLSVRQVYAKYHATLLVNGKPYKGLQTIIQREGKKPLIAQWGGIPLQRRMGLPLNDIPIPYWGARVELVQRLLAETCELCGSHRDIEVHVRRFGGRDRAHLMVRELMEGSLYTPLTLPSKEEGDHSMWGRPGREKSPIF